MSATGSPGVGISSHGRRGHTHTVPAVPQGYAGRATPQATTALERANEIRLARAALRRRIARGEVTAAAVILECPDCAASWPLGEVLACQRRWGPSRMRKFLSRSHITETKPLGNLTERQRRMLARMLGESVAVDEQPDPSPAGSIPLSPAEVQAVVDYLTVPL